MFKKLVTVSLILAASSSVAFAKHNYKGDYKNEAPAVEPCPTYQFAAGPYLGLSVGNRTNFTHSPTAYNGLQGTLSGGYGMMLSPSWYLAGELFIGNSAELNDYRLAGNGARSTWDYGVSIIPGYMITDYVMAYLRAGVVRDRFSDQASSSTGGQVGLGAQTNVYDNWDVRTEYTYTAYRSVTGISAPKSGQFNIGLVYKFV